MNDVAEGNEDAEGVDDWQFMLAQDPAYLLWMQSQELEYECELRMKEHSESLEDDDGMATD